MDGGAAMVTQAMSGGLDANTADVDGWAADVDALLAERDPRGRPCAAPSLPAQAVGQHAGRPRPRPGRGRATAAPSAADPARPACPAGHRISRLGAAVLPRRAAVRPRRPARRRRPRRRRCRRARRTAGRVRGVAVGGAHADRRGGPVRHGHRRPRGAGPHRRDLRRRRRRHHGGGLEDRRTPRHSRSQAARGDSARGLPAGVGATAVAARWNRCARHSTTCGQGEPSAPTRCPAPTTSSRCWTRPRSCGRSSAPG